MWHFFESHHNDSLNKSKKKKKNYNISTIYTYQSTGSLKASKKKPKDKNWNQIPARRLLNSWGDKSGFRSHLGVMSRYTRYTHVSYIQELNGGALQEDSKSSHHFYSILQRAKSGKIVQKLKIHTMCPQQLYETESKI